MLKFLMKFRQEEDGVVTVDFVVLTAAITVMGLFVGASVLNGAKDVADRSGNSLQDRPLGTDFEY